MIHRAMSKWGVMGNPLLSMVNKYTINLIYDNQMQELTHNNLTNREKIINHVKNKIEPNFLTYFTQVKKGLRTRSRDMARAR